MKIEVQKIQSKIKQASLIYLKQGEQLYNQKQYEQAILQFDKALQKNSSLVECYYQKAQALIELIQEEQAKMNDENFCSLDENEKKRIGYYNEALNCYDQSLKVDTNKLRAYCGKAEILLKLTQFDETIKFCDEYIQNIDLMNQHLEQKIQNLKQLENINLQNIEIKESLYKIHKIKADALIFLEKYLETLNCYDECIKMKPNDYYSYKGSQKNRNQLDVIINMHQKVKVVGQYESSANVLIELQKQPQGIKFFDKCIQIKSINYDPYIKKATLLIKLEKYDESIKCFNECIQYYPNDLKALNGKASVLNGQEKYCESIQWYDEYISSSPDDSQFYIRKASVLFELGKYQESIEFYEKSFVIDQNNFDGYDGKANSLYELKNYEGPVQCFDDFVNMHPNFFDAYNKKAKILIGLVQENEAMLCYDEYVRLKPNDSKGYKGKAFTLFEIEKYEASIYYYDECLRLDPDDLDAYSGKANALTEMNKNNEAVQCQEIFRFETEEEMTVQNINDLMNKRKEFRIKSKISYENSIIELQQRYESIKYFDQCFYMADPKDFDAYKGRADAFNKCFNELIESKQFEEAIKYYEECIQRNSNYFDAFFRKANALCELKGYNVSIKCDDYLWNSDIYKDQISFLAKLNKYQDTLKQFDECLELQKSLHFAVYCEMMCYQFLINLQMKKQLIYFFHLAIALFQLKIYDKSIQSYDDCLWLEPNICSLYVGKASLLKKLTIYQQTIQCIRISQRPDKTDLYYRIIKSK